MLRIGHQCGVISVCSPIPSPIVRYQSLSLGNLLSSAVRIQVGVAVAWPACILLTTRRLYHIVSATVGTTRSRSEVCYRIKFGVAKN